MTASGSYQVYWSKSDVAALRYHYPRRGAEYCAKKLGRTTQGTYIPDSSLGK